MEITVRTDDLLTVAYAASTLHVSRMTLYRWIKDYKIVAIRLNHSTFIPKSEIERLISLRALGLQSLDRIPRSPS